MVRLKLAELKAASESDLISEQWEREIAIARAKVKITTDEIEKKQQELADYRAEIIKVIRGQSRLTEELLNSVIDETTAAIETAQKQLTREQADLDELIESASDLRQEYSKILTWADLYDQGTFAAKKMIVSQFVKAVYVHRNYDLDVEFNVSFEDFQHYRLAGNTLTAKKNPLAV